MDAHKKIREHISALGDGELASSDLELASAALGAADGEHAWILYHRIGDVLRAAAAPDFSAGFNERLAARLAAEPPPLRRAIGEAAQTAQAAQAATVANRGSATVAGGAGSAAATGKVATTS